MIEFLAELEYALYDELSQNELANTNSGFTSHGIFYLYPMIDISTSTESYLAKALQKLDKVSMVKFSFD
ncbi:hypothetical protein [Campylobacter devanensis]|uniref:hypothetical protein n=1 Tax=Campylobacter devanensis TaxID=3161138 RepID=UPI000A33913C|nr:MULTISPECIES: hypothetical protein [unclassified Campylobacter]